MKIKLRLSDADRERLGCEVEWLDVDPMTVSAREAALMQAPFFPGPGGVLEGFDTPRDWWVALRGTPMVDATGAPVMADPEDGEPPRQKRRPHFGADLVLVWLALKRNGVAVPLAELDYDQAGARFVQPVEPEPEGATGGKDPAGAGPKTTSRARSRRTPRS